MNEVVVGGFCVVETDEVRRLVPEKPDISTEFLDGGDGIVLAFVQDSRCNVGGCSGGQ